MAVGAFARKRQNDKNATFLFSAERIFAIKHWRWHFHKHINGHWNKANAPTEKQRPKRWLAWDFPIASVYLFENNNERQLLWIASRIIYVCLLRKVNGICRSDSLAKAVLANASPQSHCSDIQNDDSAHKRLNRAIHHSIEHHVISYEVGMWNDVLLKTFLHYHMGVFGARRSVDRNTAQIYHELKCQPSAMCDCDRANVRFINSKHIFGNLQSIVCAFFSQSECQPPMPNPTPAKSKRSLSIWNGFVAFILSVGFEL